MHIFNYTPNIEEEDVASVVNCIRGGIANPEWVLNTENKLSNMFNIESVLCNSGTSALHLALLSLNIGIGDEVICPDFTFSATWNAIEYVGATPVFVDVNKSTWCVDALDIEKSITSKTKAVITVDLFGNACDYEPIVKLCKEKNLYLIQDCAESLGTTYRNKSVFQIGDISCTSFNLNKILTSCGGGALFSKNSNYIDFSKRLINQNKKGKHYDYYGIGFNYRMGSINAALLNNQIDRISSIIEKKKKVFKGYEEGLFNIPGIRFQKITKNTQFNYWVCVVQFSSNKIRDKVLYNLLEHNIESKIPFKPATLVNWIKEKYNCSALNNSKKIYENSLILPSSPNIDIDCINFICNTIKESIK